jgi:hypothetical protein
VIAFGMRERQRRADWWDQPENEVASESDDRYVRVISTRTAEDGHQEVAIVRWEYRSPTVELLMRDGEVVEIRQPFDAMKSPARRDIEREVWWDAVSLEWDLTVAAAEAGSEEALTALPSVADRLLKAARAE